MTINKDQQDALRHLMRSEGWEVLMGFVKHDLDTQTRNLIGADEETERLKFQIKCRALTWLLKYPEEIIQMEIQDKNEDETE